MKYKGRMNKIFKNTLAFAGVLFVFGFLPWAYSLHVGNPRLIIGLIIFFFFLYPAAWAIGNFIFERYTEFKERRSA